MPRDLCPTGCGRAIRAGHLMCGICWGEVPRELKTAVRDSWNAYQALAARAGIASRDRRAARLTYQQAADAAVGSIA